MAAPAVSRFSLSLSRIEKMTWSLLLKKCVASVHGRQRCTRALMAGNIRCYSSDEKKPALVPTSDFHEVLTSPELEEKQREVKKYIILNESEDVSLVSGIPEEHIKTRTVRIFQPAKNAMQSGTNNINHWKIDFETRERWENPLMGWSSTGDPLSNMNVDFATKEEAIHHCTKMNWKYYIQESNIDDPKPRSYGANFSWNKRTRVTTK